MSEQLSLTRLGHLLWSDLVNRYRAILMISGTIAALMLATGLLSAAFSSNADDGFSGWAYGTLFIWGMIAASMSLRELHDKEKNQTFLLLPASALEKVISRLLLVTIGFAVYIIVIMHLVSWLNAGLSFVLFGRNRYVPVFGSELWPRLAFFMVNQSLFFLGAAWFRKLHFIKTVFALTLLNFALTIFCVVVFRVAFSDLIGAFGYSDVDPAVFAEGWPQLRPLLRIALVACFTVLPVFCWVVAWLRVKETQVSHGV